MGCLGGHKYVHVVGGVVCSECDHFKPFKYQTGGGNKTKFLAVTLVVLIAGGAFWYLVYPDTNPGEVADVIQNAIPGDLDEGADSLHNAARTLESGIRATVEQVDFSSLPIGTESGFDAMAVERYIHEFTNSERLVRGLNTLERIPIIDDIARGHSQDMADRDYFEHDTPEGLGPSDRGAAKDYHCKKDFGSYYTTGLAENIFQAYTYSAYMTKGIPTSYSWIESEEALAKSLVDGWMDSPGHRETILTPNYDRIGVGVVIRLDEAVYATQNFC